MPRINRGLNNGLIYHVLNRGNGKQEIFHDRSDYSAFLKLMKEAKGKFSVEILAYCLMPNHFHMLIMPSEANELSKYMQWLLTSHVRRYHKHYGTTGHIWQGRFKSFIIQKNDYLLTVLRYIERNPVRADLVKSAKDWKWSSHAGSLRGERRLLADEFPIDLPRDWTQYVDNPLTLRELTKLRKSTNRGTPYGAPSWQIEVSEKLGLVSTLKPRGRPPKNIAKIEKVACPLFGG